MGNITTMYGITKSQITSSAKSSVDNILENGNLLESAEAIAAMEQFIKAIKAHDLYKQSVIDELAKYGKSYVNSNGTKIEPMEAAIKYDFSACGDIILKGLEEKLEILETLIKERQTFLKSVPLSGLDLVTEEGEVIRLYPPSKSSTSTYKITLAK